jgi:hypothetical protein
MALIQFIVTPGRRHCMILLLATAWAVTNSNPFDLDALVAPGTVLPVVALFFSVLAWAAYASTRLCHHGVGTAAVVMWTLNILFILKLVVFGYAPAFGFAALMTAPLRTVPNTPCGNRGFYYTMIIGALIAVGCVLIADPGRLLSPGGYRTFHPHPSVTADTVMTYLAAFPLAIGTYYFPSRTNPIQTLAYSSSMVLLITAIVGFMASMTELDNSGSMAGVDFYHCCFLFAWSSLLYAVVLLLCAFHVLELAYDAFAALGLTTISVAVMQWIITHEPPNSIQIAGICLLAASAALLRRFHCTDTVLEAHDDKEFHDCQECEHEREKAVASALNDSAFAFSDDDTDTDIENADARLISHHA